MTLPGQSAAHTSFVRVSRAHASGATQVVLSRAALHLHTFGVLSSIESGRDGFVGDCYLGAIAAETSIAALELCLAGLWSREAGGYRVDDGDVRQVRGRIRVQLGDLAARCRTEGGHRADREHPGLCARCGTPSPAGTTIGS